MNSSKDLGTGEEDETFNVPPSVELPPSPSNHHPSLCLFHSFTLQCSNDVCRALNHCSCPVNRSNYPNFFYPPPELRPRIISNTPSNVPDDKSDSEESIRSTKCEVNSEIESVADQSSESSSSESESSGSSSSEEEQEETKQDVRPEFSAEELMKAEEAEAVRRNKRRHPNIDETRPLRKRIKAKLEFTKDEYYIEAHQSFRTKIHTKLFHISNSLKRRHPSRVEVASKRERSPESGKFLSGKQKTQDAVKTAIKKQPPFRRTKRN
jgi:hypothetical protein